MELDFRHDQPLVFAGELVYFPHHIALLYKMPCLLDDRLFAQPHEHFIGMVNRHWILVFIAGNAFALALDCHECLVAGNPNPGSAALVDGKIALATEKAMGMNTPFIAVKKKLSFYFFRHTLQIDWVGSGSGCGKSRKYRAIVQPKSDEALVKPASMHRGIGILPMIQGRDAHAKRGFARASVDPVTCVKRKGFLYMPNLPDAIGRRANHLHNIESKPDVTHLKKLEIADRCA